MDNLKELAAAERRAYKNAWNARNPSKNAEYQRRFWERRAERKLKEQGGEAGTGGTDEN
jgi:hypothetical protein